MRNGNPALGGRSCKSFVYEGKNRFFWANLFVFMGLRQKCEFCEFRSVGTGRGGMLMLRTGKGIGSWEELFHSPYCAPPRRNSAQWEVVCLHEDERLGGGLTAREVHPFGETDWVLTVRACRRGFRALFRRSYGAG